MSPPRRWRPPPGRRRAVSSTAGRWCALFGSARRTAITAADVERVRTCPATAAVTHRRPCRQRHATGEARARRAASLRAAEFARGLAYRRRRHDAHLQAQVARRSSAGEHVSRRGGAARGRAPARIRRRSNPRLSARLEDAKRVRRTGFNGRSSSSPSLGAHAAVSRIGRSRDPAKNKLVEPEMEARERGTCTIVQCFALL